MKPNQKFPLVSFLIFYLLFFIISKSAISADRPLKEAQFYKKLENKVVRCQLCPRQCVIPEKRRGYCGVRENQGGILYTLVFSKPVAIHIDPIEKKPLFHFLPATTAFSIATAGCNLKCKFCQNWEISQARPEEIEYTYIEPKDLVKKALASGAPTIAYTYSEPTIFYEYMLETAKLARQAGLKNVMHSNGYINEAPLRKLAKYLDAANIDLKAFTDDYYKKMTDSSLEPVLKSLKALREEGVFIEITNLILPGYNDDPAILEKMCNWIKDNLGEDTPLHFSRFYPMYKLTALNPTPVSTLERARQIALNCGLRYVYIGNVGGSLAENTYCPKCGKVVVGRKGYFVTQYNLENGNCKFCGERISGVWR
ncbi:MAG: AmmeMemoRadiSam system radical SAM enzyme [Candidatus Omnitrophica bacterium]|nr:AmmeMemoRadiSam system radical SAM enzyme [Candidatus Omnitrophota bacterium]MBU1870409.1 AmmeMemoRadiSam system radical SAM enzyme [Candidatus Omnitrophota bacterium]